MSTGRLNIRMSIGAVPGNQISTVMAFAAWAARIGIPSAQQIQERWGLKRATAYRWRAMWCAANGISVPGSERRLRDFDAMRKDMYSQARAGVLPSIKEMAKFYDISAWTAAKWRREAVRQLST